MPINFSDETTIAGILVFLFGISFGSFVTLASYRLPRGEDIIFKSSRCPSCNHDLGFFDLFPVLSWIARSGKCAHCGKKVSVRYPLIELAVGLVFLMTYMKLGISLHSVILLLLAMCLIIIIATDLEYTIIPDSVQITMLFLGVVYRLLPETMNILQIFIGPIIGICSGLLLRKIFTRWKKQEALGMGDVKFLAVVGIFLQKDLIITFLFLSGVIGILTALLWSAVERGKQFPFGPALAVSLYFCLVMPEVQYMVKEYIISILMN